MSDEEYLGLDIGTVRVGVARASAKARIAEAMTVWPADKAVAQLEVLARTKTLAGVVVGLPRNLNGDETKQTATVRRWVDEAKAHLKLNFFWQDEALSSRRALEELTASRDNLDAMAAALILQDFMDTPPAGRQLA